MTRLTDLLKNSNHDAVESCKFMQRLCYRLPHDLPEQEDVVRISYQLLFLYEALEARLASLEAADACLSVFQEAPWENRSQELKKDIQQMEASLDSPIRGLEKALPLTVAFCKDIAKADPITLFAYFSVRCLGDSYGGQKLMEHASRAFNAIELDHHFYKSAQGQAMALSRRINHTALPALNENSAEDEKAFFKAGDAMFLFHKNLFEQLERQRQVAASRCINVKLPSLKSSLVFFAGASILAIGVASQWETSPYRP